MTNQYQVAGITCNSCVDKVKTVLGKIPGVTAAVVGLDGEVQVTMSHHITTSELQDALRDYPKYQLTDNVLASPAEQLPDEAADRSFLETYKPILLLFSYIFGTTLIVEAAIGSFEWMRWMRHFMAGFFLVFSFFKMLDVSAFASSYTSYDVVARRWSGWGYVYPFIELALGLLFLINFNALITNSLTFIVMGISTIGVVQSLMAKRHFQCACLGTVFNLPMSTVTLVEDLLMVAMSGVMLIFHF